MRNPISRQWRDNDIRNAAILISLVLSIWHILVNPVPNTDAFDYVRTAHVYLDQALPQHSNGIHPRATQS